MKLDIKVQPNSGRQDIQKITEGSYKVFLRKPPEDNKANGELIKFLKKHFKAEVKIIKGLTSKRKLIDVNNGN